MYEYLDFLDVWGLYSVKTQFSMLSLSIGALEKEHVSELIFDKFADQVDEENLFVSIDGDLEVFEGFVNQVIVMALPPKKIENRLKTL